MSENKFGISIIMPCYNTEKYIGKTLQSLYDQTLQNFEIVFINDGSTDNTMNMILTCKEKLGDRVKIIDKENEGQSKARNVGLNEALGEYIVFLDSDDYVANDYLEVLYKAAKEADSDMVLSGQKKVTEDGEVIASIDYPVDKFPGYVVRRMNPHGKIYRRAFLDEHNIRFAEGKLYEDNPFNLVAMFLCKNQVILPYNGHFQVIHDGSTMTKRMDPNKVPYAAIENSIRYVLEHKNLITDMDIFVFNVLSFMTYFIFEANRVHIYAKEKIKGRKSDPELMKTICKFTQRVIPEYIPDYYKCPHIGIFKNRYLMLSHRMGVWLFVRLLRTNTLQLFTKLYYLVF